MPTISRRRTATVIALAFALSVSPSLQAAGFAIIEHSAKGLGNAFSGGGAVAEDASTVFFNPASITRLADQIQVSTHIIEPSFDYSDHGSTQIGSPLTLLRNSAATDNGGKRGFVPNLYYVKSLGEQGLFFGLSVNVPFGLSTEYEPNWKGRYHAIESQIRTINLNPALAYRINSWLSIGAGVSAQYIEAKLSSAIDLVAVCANTGRGIERQMALPAGALSSTCTGIANGPGQGANDGFTQNKADDISFGYNLGIMLELSDSTRLSIGYRSQVEHELDGKASFTLPASIASNAALDTAVASAFRSGGITVAADMPQQFSFSVFHQFHRKWAATADVTWTDWSSIPQLRIVYDDPTTTGDGVAIENLQWNDAWRLSLGVQHQYNDRVTIRSGIAWDQSPAHDPTLRTPRLPDNNRWWFAFGGSFDVVPKRLSLDLGYVRLEMPKTRIQRTNETGATLLGSFDTHANILSAQLNWRFD